MIKFHHRLHLIFKVAIFAGTVSISHLFAVDSDADGMDDSYEITEGLSVGSDDRYGDIDGDGYPNLLEYLKSTSASSSSSVPTADRVVGPLETYTTITAALRGCLKNGGWVILSCTR